MKKILLALLTAAVVLTSCGPAKTEIELYYYKQENQDGLKLLVNEFQKDNPNISVKLLVIPNDADSAMSTRASQGELPAIMQMQSYARVQEYASKGYLVDLSGTEVISKVVDSSLPAVTYDGKAYALPMDFAGIGIIYNKDIFDEKHLSYPDKNTTFEEFLTLARKTTDLDKGIFGISFEEDPLFYLPYLMSEGGGLLSDDGRVEILDTEESRRGIKFYADLRNKYHTAPKQSESASATMAQMFLQGKLAMLLSGRWLVPKFRESADFDWDVAPFPKGTKGSIVPLDASGWAISKDSKHKAEAARLIKYLSSKESLEKFALSGLVVPAREDAAKSRNFLDGKRPYNAQIFLEVARTSKPTPVSRNYNEILDRTKQMLV